MTNYISAGLDTHARPAFLPRNSHSSHSENLLVAWEPGLVEKKHDFRAPGKLDGFSSASNLMSDDKAGPDKQWLVWGTDALPDFIKGTRSHAWARELTRS